MLCPVTTNLPTRTNVIFISFVFKLHPYTCWDYFCLTYSIFLHQSKSCFRLLSQQRLSEEPYRFGFCGLGRWQQFIRVGNFDHGTGRNYFWRGILQGTVGLSSRLSKYAADDDLRFGYVASECLWGWQGLYLHPSSTRWRCLELARTGYRALATNPWCGANSHIRDFNALRSQRWKSRKFGRSCPMEKRQKSFQEESATDCSKEPGRIEPMFA